MHVRKKALVFIPFLLLVFLTGCASTTAPGDWLPTAQEAQMEAYGSWIYVEYATGSSSFDKVDGELIAIGDDTVFILSSTDQLVSIPLDKIESAKLTTYDAKHGVLGLWTLGGSLSTASHGIVLIISLPVWILSGSITTAAQSYAPIEKFPIKSWDDLRKYARFPQGLPDGLKLEKLRSKWK